MGPARTATPAQTYDYRREVFLILILLLNVLGASFSHAETLVDRFSSSLHRPVPDLIAIAAEKVDEQIAAGVQNLDPYLAILVYFIGREIPVRRERRQAIEVVGDHLRTQMTIDQSRALALRLKNKQAFAELRKSARDLPNVQHEINAQDAAKALALTVAGGLMTVIAAPMSAFGILSSGRRRGRRDLCRRARFNTATDG